MWLPPLGTNFSPLFPPSKCSLFPPSKCPIFIEVLMEILHVYKQAKQKYPIISQISNLALRESVHPMIINFSLFVPEVLGKNVRCYRLHLLVKKEKKNVPCDVLKNMDKILNHEFNSAWWHVFPSFHSPWVWHCVLTWKSSLSTFASWELLKYSM